ncbi:28S ribosomal protein S33, mitochondrial isoform X2 [Motacilla alba alba]|uniref:28S ribosomal protein S33, mitochondrial isoform X2 n=1 Tax=Motacilla alba alba TaxID=1094192 RepID=UPI0018D52C5E|nr:28S ribosomal protein S33, mitochondrial isoform X2 [Motacilla alba alba]
MKAEAFFSAGYDFSDPRRKPERTGKHVCRHGTEERSPVSLFGGESLRRALRASCQSSLRTAPRGWGRSALHPRPASLPPSGASCSAHRLSRELQAQKQSERLYKAVICQNHITLNNLRLHCGHGMHYVRQSLLLMRTSPGMLISKTRMNYFKQNFSPDCPVWTSCLGNVSPSSWSSAELYIRC